MAKARKSKSSLKKSLWLGETVRRFAGHGAIALLFVGSLTALVWACREYVADNPIYLRRPPVVVLKDRPEWMSDTLAEQIIKSAEPIGPHSVFDQQLLVDTANALKSNPWVRKVNQVRRVFGERPGDTLEIDCEYRAPVALVHWANYFWLVDADGTELPEQCTAAQVGKMMYSEDGKINLRIISGVVHAPPQAGEVWPGDDLMGGLEMAKLVAGRDWAEQIPEIDVSNFNGRMSTAQAQILLKTKSHSVIRWGRPPGAKDAFVEVAASVKLAALQNIYEQTGTVDDHQPWLDIRFDQVIYQDPDAAIPAGHRGTSADASR
jgi:hypothetical protein